MLNSMYYQRDSLHIFKHPTIVSCLLAGQSIVWRETLPLNLLYNYLHGVCDHPLNTIPYFSSRLLLLQLLRLLHTAVASAAAAAVSVVEAAAAAAVDAAHITHSLPHQLQVCYQIQLQTDTIQYNKNRQSRC